MRENGEDRQQIMQRKRSEECKNSKTARTQKVSKKVSKLAEMFQNASDIPAFLSEKSVASLTFKNFVFLQKTKKIKRKFVPVLHLQRIEKNRSKAGAVVVVGENYFETETLLRL